MPAYPDFGKLFPACSLGSERWSALALRAIQLSVFVQHLLRDLTFANLAPLPAVRPDHFVKVLLGDPDRPEPDLHLGRRHAFEFAAASEMEEIRAPLGGRALGAI